MELLELTKRDDLEIKEFVDKIHLFRSSQGLSRISDYAIIMTALNFKFEYWKKLYGAEDIDNER